MLPGQTISASAFCSHHHIQISFLHALHEYGLIEIETGETDCFLSAEEVERIEKMIRLHYDLQINLEGIDAIHHLLQQMENMQQELELLRSQLRSHEE